MFGIEYRYLFEFLTETVDRYAPTAVRTAGVGENGDVVDAVTGQVGAKCPRVRFLIERGKKIAVILFSQEFYMFSGNGERGLVFLIRAEAGDDRRVAGRQSSF